MEIGESDAKKLHISHGDKVKIISTTSEITAIANITETLPEGKVFMPNSFPDSPANSLFSVSLDPETKAPSLKACPVRIERVELNEQDETKSKD